MPLSRPALLYKTDFGDVCRDFVTLTVGRVGAATDTIIQKVYHDSYLSFFSWMLLQHLLAACPRCKRLSLIAMRSSVAGAAYAPIARRSSGCGAPYAPIDMSSSV